MTLFGFKKFSLMATLHGVEKPSSFRHFLDCGMQQLRGNNSSLKSSSFWAVVVLLVSMVSNSCSNLATTEPELTIQSSLLSYPQHCSSCWTASMSILTGGWLYWWIMSWTMGLEDRGLSEVSSGLFNGMRNAQATVMAMMDISIMKTVNPDNNIVFKQKWHSIARIQRQYWPESKEYESVHAPAHPKSALMMKTMAMAMMMITNTCSHTDCLTRVRSSRSWSSFAYSSLTSLNDMIKWNI